MDSDVAPNSSDTWRFVLVVDDDRAVRNALCRGLRGPGCAVMAAGSVRQALAIPTRKPPAVVVTDFEMPGGSGLDLLHALRQRYGESTPPVVLYSGSNVELPANHGFAAVVSKPAPIDELRELVDSLSAEHASSRRGLSA